jgi:hypothetical protein
MRRSISLLSALLFLAACGDDSDPGVDAGGTDASMEDALAVDVGTDSGIECGVGEVPLGRGEHAALYDPTRNRIVVHGGNTTAPVMCSPRFTATDEVWVYDVACETWSMVPPTGRPGPGARVRSGFVYDPAGDRGLLFGGRFRAGDSGPYTNFDDVWSLDLATMAWTQLATTGTGPSARNNAGVAIDTVRNQLLVFGGNTSTSGLTPTGDSELFALDLNTLAWRAIVADGPPPPRYYHDMVVFGSELFVFGGTPDFDGPFLNDLWAFDLAGETWRLVIGGGPTAPASRFGGALLATADDLMMVAGHDSTDLGNVNDLWRVDPSGTWTETQHGDTLNGRPSGACMFPSDFTIPDLAAPERRHGFGIARGADRSFVVFGKTDCGNANDVWVVNHTTGQWEEIGDASTSGESCNRNGATECTNLCF